MCVVTFTGEEAKHQKVLAYVKQPLDCQFLRAAEERAGTSHIQESYSKLLHQGEALNTMIRLKESIRDHMYKVIPKQYQSRVKQLYAAVEPYVKVNTRGEILNDYGVPIGGSRLEDLIQYAIRDHRRKLQPEGWHFFLSKLFEYNVPKTTLNAATVDELHHFKLPPTVKTVKSVKKEVESSSEDEIASPIQDYNTLNKQVSRSRSPIRSPKETKRMRTQRRRSDFHYYN